MFVDSGRAELFRKVNFQTALAVPIFSSNSVSPACVLCCYSYVRTGSVPFVLRFVQQALRLLWDGLDKVEPHESVGRELWQDVAPADLGEMAADVEMQQHFMVKKRPRAAISSIVPGDDPESSLSRQLGALDTPSGIPSTNSIYTGQHGYSPTVGPSEEPVSPELNAALPSIGLETLNNVHSHIQNAVNSVAEAIPFPVHKHVSTNTQDSKRAHVLGPSNAAPAGHTYGQAASTTIYNYAGNQYSEHSAPAPLPAPRPLPLPNQLVAHPPPPAATNSQQQHDEYQQQPTLLYHANQNQQIHQTMVQPDMQQQPVYVYQPEHINQMQQPISQHDQHQQYFVHQTDINQTMAAPINPSTSSVHFDHTYSSNIQTMPTAMSQAPPAAAPMASVPTNQISARGISFAQPQPVHSNAVSPTPIAEGSIPNAQNHVALSASMPYCLSASNDSAPPVSAGGKVRIRLCTFFLILARL